MAPNIEDLFNVHNNIHVNCGEWSVFIYLGVVRCWHLQYALPGCLKCKKKSDFIVCSLDDVAAKKNEWQRAQSATESRWQGNLFSLCVLTVNDIFLCVCRCCCWLSFHMCHDPLAISIHTVRINAAVVVDCVDIASSSDGDFIFDFTLSHFLQFCQYFLSFSRIAIGHYKCSFFERCSVDFVS